MSFVFDVDHPHGLPPEDLRRLVGGKAANLAVMARELDLPVPPAIVITTEACRRFLAAGWPPGLDEELRTGMDRLERVIGRRFGAATDPLLVSVRSGAAVSMPGMMDTVLNLGLTDASEAGLAAATGDRAFAHDCRIRFEDLYRDVVGTDAPADPWAQLRAAVAAVFRSWNSDRALAYRRREGIPDDLGTAVTIQAMVFGNRSDDSATGVLFTRNPASGEPVLYGDVLFRAQGEDVVAGTHGTAPIEELDGRLPAVAAELRGHADRLERHFADLCDIEFTVEAGRLWLLQVRVGKRSPQAALRIAVEMAEDPAFPLDRAGAVARVADLLADPPVATTGAGDRGTPLARGLGASPGVAAGTVVLTAEAAVDVAATGQGVILVRPETSPDDVHGMAAARGILTATGGLASHAAVVARGWGIPAVVGASDVTVSADAATIGGRRVRPGEAITIDGTTGEVFAGAVAGAAVVVAEAAVLLRWARELGIAIPDRADAAAASAPPGPGDPSGSTATGGGPTAEDAIRAMAVKGFVTPESLGLAIRGGTEDAGALLDRLVADGLAEIAVGSFRLTTDGKSVGAELLASDAAHLGPARAADALDAFVALDRRMKEAVTAWQTREVDGAQVVNAHDDPEHDARVLADLAALAADTDAWLAPLTDALARLGRYRERLALAAAEVAAGNGRYVASPRVDSYHGVWFELHEDLIRLAGRSRADEIAAGRA